MNSPNQARINRAAFASVAALSLASCGSSFGERCREAFTDPFDVDDCVERLSNGGSLRPPAPDGYWHDRRCAQPRYRSLSICDDTHNPSKGD